jgi:hypothetical protein
MNFSYEPWWIGDEIPSDRLAFSPEEQEQLLALPRRKEFTALKTNIPVKFHMLQNSSIFVRVAAPFYKK